MVLWSEPAPCVSTNWALGPPQHAKVPHDLEQVARALCGRRDGRKAERLAGDLDRRVQADGALLVEADQDLERDLARRFPPSRPARV